MLNYVAIIKFIRKWYIFNILKRLQFFFYSTKCPPTPMKLMEIEFSILLMKIKVWYLYRLYFLKNCNIFKYLFFNHHSHLFYINSSNRLKIRILNPLFNCIRYCWINLYKISKQFLILTWHDFNNCMGWLPLYFFMKFVCI